MRVTQPGGSGGGGGGTTLTAEVPVGTVNGSNTSFTVSHTPLFIIIDGMFKIVGQGYTFSNPTITTDALNPPVNFIESYYNA